MALLNTYRKLNVCSMWLLTTDCSSAEALAPLQANSYAHKCHSLLIKELFKLFHFPDKTFDAARYIFPNANYRGNQTHGFVLLTQVTATVSAMYTRLHLCIYRMKMNYLILGWLISFMFLFRERQCFTQIWNCISPMIDCLNETRILWLSLPVHYGSETHLREVPIYVKSRIVTS